MRILFIQPPHYFESGTRVPTTFPLGLCYVATAAQEAGHQVEVLDIWLGQYESIDVEKKVEELFNFDVFAITALSTQYKYIKWLSKILKNHHPDIPIVLGNALATYSADTVLKNTKVDICVRGEGEYTFKDLLDSKLKRLNHIGGISYRDSEGKIIHNPEREYVSNLDDIPFPSYEIFDIEAYLSHLRVWGRPDIVAMNVVCGRGCPYGCHFCSKTFQYSRLRSIENIVEEIELLKESYKIEGIFFLDELVVVSKERTEKLCMNMRRLKLKWNCQARVNTTDEDLLRLMKKSGCVAVGFGVESGSQEILNRMNKKIRVSQAIEVAKAAIRLDLNPNFQMMYGYPGEDDDTLEETIGFFDEIKYFLKHPLSVTTPIPGSRLYDDCLRQKLINDEDHYLEALDQGYYYRTHPLINLTEFTDREFMEKKTQTEETINRNYRLYLKRNPIHYINYYFHRYLNTIVLYYRIHGLFSTFKKVGKKILHVNVIK